MVFYQFRAVFNVGREFRAFMFRVVSLFCVLPDGGWSEDWKKAAVPFNKCSVFTVFGPGGHIPGLFRTIKSKKRYRAMFTLEATMVMGVVLMMLMATIRYGFVLHDEVTGSMILEETLEKARYLPEDALKEELEDLERQGTEIGTPRIWLGAYEVEVKNGWNTLTGQAMAGEWEQEITIAKCRPGDFLREYEGIKVQEERAGGDGS